METKIKTVMSQVLGVPVTSIGNDTSTDTLTKWDSLGHMNLCLALEEEFNVQFEDSQVIGMTSYPKIVDTVGRLSGR